MPRLSPRLAAHPPRIGGRKIALARRFARAETFGHVGERVRGKRAAVNLDRRHDEPLLVPV